MAGTSAARRFTDDDKARVYATLAANGGNVKRTSRECDVPPATIRRWRGQWDRQGPPPDANVTKAVTEFLDEAVSVRNLALTKLREKIECGDVKASELITALGVLDDKITRAKGLPTSKVEHSSALPSREDLKELMQGFVAGAIEAAERRHGEIVDAEVVEVAPVALPSGA